MLKQLKRFSVPCLSVLLALHLSACDSSSRPDAPPERTILDPVFEQFVQANVQIQFPPPVSQTEAETLTVRGIVQDSSGIARLRLNDIDVDSDDGFATWSIEVPLAQGLNSLRLVSENAEGDIEELSELLVTRREIDLVAARKLHVDRNNNRLLALDFSERALIAVDLNSGARSVFSPPSGSENLIRTPTGFIIHEPSNAALVAQSRDAPLISVDLTTGMQSELTPSGLEDLNFLVTNQAMTPSLDGAYIAGSERVYRRQVTYTEVNEAGNEVRVTRIERVQDSRDANIRDADIGLIYHIDAITGERTVVSNFDTENAGRLLSREIRSISTTPDSDLIYVLERFVIEGLAYYAVSTVDKSTGRREEFELVFPEAEEETDSTEQTDPEQQPEVPPIDSEDEDAAPVEPPPVLTLSGALELQLDYANNRLWLLTTGRVFGKIDLTTRVGEIVAGPTVPEDADLTLQRVESFAVDQLEQRAYLSDVGFQRIVWVDTNTGERHLLTSSGPDDPQNNLSFITPNAVAFDLLNQQAYITDPRRQAVFQYDVLSGTKTRLPSGNSDDGEVVLRSLLGADFDDLTGRLTVLDNPLLGGRSLGLRRLLDVDPATGVSTIIFQYNVGNRGLRDVLYDPHSGAYFILENGLLLRVIPGEDGTAQASFLSGGNIPSTSFPFSSNLRSMVLDAANERILVLDMTRRAVMAVDWDTGERSFLSRAPGNPAPDGGEDGEVRFQVPRAMSLDPLRNRVLVLDSGLKAIIAVDLDSGERSVVASNQGITGERMVTPRGLAVHPIYNYALVIDDSRNSLMAVDLVTNERVTLSR